MLIDLYHGHTTIKITYKWDTAWLYSLQKVYIINPMITKFLKLFNLKVMKTI